MGPSSSSEAAGLRISLPPSTVQRPHCHAHRAAARRYFLLVGISPYSYTIHKAARKIFESFGAKRNSTRSLQELLPSHSRTGPSNLYDHGKMAENPSWDPAIAKLLECLPLPLMSYHLTRRICPQEEAIAFRFGLGISMRQTGASSKV